MERKLTAILSADVKGYSRLMGEDEEATLRTLTTYREEMAAIIRQHRGRVVDSPGDNLLAEFASVVDAVQCAVIVQATLKAENANLPANRQMEFRIGINVGDVLVEGERIYGDGVNVAARVEGLAEPGGICISGTVHEQIEDKLALRYENLGEQEVKNIAKPVRVYRVQMEPGAARPTVSQGKRVGLRRSPMTALALVVLLFVGAGVVVLRFFPRQPSSPPATVPSEETSALPLPGKPSLVVLPFDNMSNDPEQEYFSDGMTDDLTTDLSKISNLFVIARNSAFTYKGKAAKVQKVGRELGVRYVLEGSVRKADDQVRINAQLVDAATGRHLWSERYDRPYKDFFAVQDDITQKIVAALEIKLTKGEQERLARRYTDNLEAYDLFLRGKAYALRYTEDANLQAQEMFERAIVLDPEYADAYGMLASTYFIEWIQQWSPNPAQPLERFVELAHRAVALDDSVPGPHAILGYAYLYKDRRYAEAIAELQKAVSLAPNDGDVYWWLAFVLNSSARHEEALEAIRKGMRLNPHYPADYEWLLGWAYHGTGQTEKALAAYKRAINLNPDFQAAHLFLASVYIDLGREAEARTEVAEVLRISPNFTVEKHRRASPYPDKTVLEHFYANLRKAGIP